MVWSPELTATPGTGPTEWSSRLGQSIRYFQVHHTANFNIDSAYALMLPGDRTVSCNALVGPKGEKWGVVPEEYRAFTSGSAMVDRMSYTVETVNSTGAPTWGISAAAHEALVDLLVDVATRHKFWPNRQGDKKTWTVIGHREIGEIWPGESYATACPGGIDLDRLTADAQKRMSAPAPPVQRRTSMTTNFVKESTLSTTRTVVFGKTLYATAGDSPGTPANWIEYVRVQAKDDGPLWFQAHGPHIPLSDAEWEAYKSSYRAPLQVALPAQTPTEPAGAPLISSYVLAGTLTPKEA